MYCGFCGKEVPTGSQFCKFCGKNLQEMNSSSAKKIVYNGPASVSSDEDFSGSTAGSNKASNSTLVFFLILAIVLFCVASYYFSLESATLHTINGISTKEAPAMRAKATACVCGGIISIVLDIYFLYQRTKPN